MSKNALATLLMQGRHKTGKTLDQVAAQLPGISKGMLSRVERCEYVKLPRPFSRINEVTAAYGITVKDFEEACEVPEDGTADVYTQKRIKHYFAKEINNDIMPWLKEIARSDLSSVTLGEFLSVFEFQRHIGESLIPEMAVAFIKQERKKS
jgi:hypothetical protein